MKERLPYLSWVVSGHHGGVTLKSYRVSNLACSAASCSGVPISTQVRGSIETPNTACVARAQASNGSMIEKVSPPGIYEKTLGEQIEIPLKAYWVALLGAGNRSLVQPTNSMALFIKSPRFDSLVITASVARAPRAWWRAISSSRALSQ